MASSKTRNQPSKKTGTGRHTDEALGPELYPTPAPVTEALLEVEDVPVRVWEPAAGMGHMAAVLARSGRTVFASDLYNYGMTVDGSPRIMTGIDFTTVETAKLSEAGITRRPLAVITNPPFSKISDFVRVGLQVSPRVYVLGRLALLEGAERVDIIEGHLTRAWVFSNRLPMMHRWEPGPDGKYVEWSGKKAGSAMTFAWFRFDQQKSDPDIRVRRIRWSKSKSGQD